MYQLPSHVSPKHPLVTGNYAVCTPAIDALIDTLGGWIESKITGAYVFGPSRLGKTRAVTYFLKGYLQERLGVSLPVHIWIHTNPFNSPGTFYKSILAGLNHVSANGKSESKDLLSALVEYFILTANQCNSRHIVFVVDEAQGVGAKEWGYLMAIQNMIEREGFVFSVFAIASHQLGYEYDYLARTGDAHLAARFLIDRWRFPGVESHADLEFVLQGYDEDSDWPKNSGISYMNHFAPDEFKLGRRLSKTTDDFWAALTATLPDNFKGTPSFPMKHIARSVEEVLLNLSRGTDWEVGTSVDEWVRCLVKLRLADHMRAVSINLNSS